MEICTRAIAGINLNRKGFCKDLKGNGFAAYIVFTEKHWQELKKLKELDDLELFEAVKKLTSNYRKWEDIEMFIAQCSNLVDAMLAGH